MSIQASSSLYGINESLSRADQELFSIFLQYPDATFDDGSSVEPSQTKDSFTTPAKYRQGQVSDTSTLVEDRRSATSLHTPDLGIPAFDGEWSELKALLETSTLPQACLSYYALLGETVMNLGTELFSTIRPGRASDLVHLGTWLLKNISYSHRQTSLQVEAIASLKDSAPFMVKPNPCQIWSTYSQRARMIAR